MTTTQQQLVNSVRQCGVVGAGGAGFPTYVKLQAKVDTIIANGSECEPLLASDCTMMEKTPELLIEGMQIAMQATGAKEGIIAIKAYYENAVNALKKVLPQDDSIRLHLLENYYPAGDEFFTVYDATGKIIPEGGIPLNVGVVVNNTTTLMQIAEAVHGKPVTERAVTLVGEFNEPKVVNVPIGTLYKDLIALAGGLKTDDVVLVDGGPMMGRVVQNWEDGIAKTTSGVIAFPKDHFIIRSLQKPLEKIIKQSKSACCQCFRCTDLCPRNLLGHKIFPHKTMRTIDYNISEPHHLITSAFLCSQCGVCELIACDTMMLSPRKIFAEYRKILAAKGIKNPHNNKPVEPNSFIEYRKTSIPMLMKKLDLSKYYQKLDYEVKTDVNMVRISLTKHVGAPAIPTVKIGQKVRYSEMIAATDDAKLGATYHASIDGIISQIDNNWIEIKK